MPAFSSSSPPASCHPLIQASSFVGKRPLVLSPSTNATSTAATTTQTTTTATDRDEVPNSIRDGFVEALNENFVLSSTDYLFYSPSSLRKKRSPTIPIDKNIYKRPTIRKTIKPEIMMDASFPGHLRPSNHPILNDYLKSGSTPSIVLESFCEEPEPETPTNSKPTPIVIAPSAQPEKRRAKRYGQQGGRYRTTPITLEEIREIDEELYTKQQPLKKDDVQIDASGSSKRTTSSPYSTYSNSALTPRKTSNGALDFRCTYTTKTQLLPSRSLWLPQSNMRHRHRSQESLAQQGHTPLPTIPEEWRQQHQQQKLSQHSRVSATITQSSSAPTALQPTETPRLVEHEAIN